MMKKNCINKQTKIVVFDMDETLGYFTEFGMFWNVLIRYIHIKPQLNDKIKIDQTLFNNTLDLYPEFLRPNIINILTYLKKQKKKTHCSQIMIYTNNQGPSEWVNFIKGYFEHKLDNYKLFDQIIRAYKIGHEKVELCRTSHGKSHEDLMRCTKISPTTQICFLDDVFHPDMETDQVYYINVKSYSRELPIDDMIDRFIKNIDKINPTFLEIDTKEKMTTTLTAFFNQYKHKNTIHPANKYQVDKIISKRILEHLHEFMGKQIHNKTLRKSITKNHNKTIKQVK